jgi:hypothetical protein
MGREGENMLDFFIIPYSPGKINAAREYYFEKSEN